MASDEESSLWTQDEGVADIMKRSTEASIEGTAPADTTRARQVAVIDENGTVGNSSSPNKTPLLASQSAIRYVERNYPVRTTREGQILALLPLTNRVNGTRSLVDFRVYVELAGFLALKQFQHRSDQILIGLPERLKGCDFAMTYAHHDTQFSPIVAASALSRAEGWITTYRYSALYGNNNTAVNLGDGNGTTSTTHNNTITTNNNTESQSSSWNLTDADPLPPDSSPTTSPTTINNNNTNRHLAELVVEDEPENDWKPRKRRLQQNHTSDPTKPFAVLGAARSDVTQVLGILGSAVELPVLSSSSTATIVDESEFLARALPANTGDAHALIAYLHNIGITHLAVLFLKGTWGRQYEQDIQESADQYNISVHSVSYTDEESLDDPMDQLKETGLRYFIGIIDPSAWKPVVRKAYEYDLIGDPERQWFFGDLLELRGGSFSLDRETESDIADALHGSGLVVPHVKPHEPFDRMFAAFADDEVLQQEFISSHAEPQLLENFTFDRLPDISLFQYLTFDAVIALGIAACDTPGLFTGPEFYKQLLKVDFEGVSGRFKLDEKTGTRIGDNLAYDIVNLVMNSKTSGIYFHHGTSAIIDLSSTRNSSALPTIDIIKPFVYYSNTTKPPPGLPPLEVNMNLIPNGVLYFGMSLSVSTMLLSIVCAIWTYIYRNEYVIRASQPIFLYQLCFGCLILASTIIPLGFQEDMPGLDAACKTIPWLLCIGFTVAISALFSKTHRINQLMASSASFRRVRVKANDVIKMSVVLLSFNVALLSGWTASPWALVWHRTKENNYDEYGRSVASYGTCRPGGSSETYLWFFIPLLLANIAILILTAVASYRARNLPTEFSETTYLALAMIGLTETCILGVTTIIPVYSIPTAFYLVSMLLVWIFCMSIIVPVFLPKYLHRNAKEPRAREATIVVASCNNPRSNLSQLQGSSGSAEETSRFEMDGESGRLRKSGNVATFFASQPQAVFRNSDSLGASSANPRGSGRKELNASGPFNISGLNLNDINTDIAAELRASRRASENIVSSKSEGSKNSKQRRATCSNR